LREKDRILREKDRGTGLALMRAKKSFDLLGFQSSLQFFHRQIWVWLVKDVKLLLPVALCFGFIQNYVLCFDLSLQLVGFHFFVAVICFWFKALSDDKCTKSVHQSLVMLKWC
jgi:hypothetical protein